MCLMLYAASAAAMPLRTSELLSVAEVQPEREAIRKWFSFPTVRFIAARQGCSCGFPSIISDEPVEYFEGMFDGADEEDRAKDLQSVRALFAFIEECLIESPTVELYPKYAEQEPRPPRGVVELQCELLRPETFVFTEEFLYRVTRR
jgi:hypothetical protein